MKVLNDALERKSKSTNVKQLIDEDSDSEIISGKKNIAQNFNNYFATIDTHKVISFLIVLPLRTT